VNTNHIHVLVASWLALAVAPLLVVAAFVGVNFGHIVQGGHDTDVTGDDARQAAAVLGLIHVEASREALAAGRANLALVHARLGAAVAPEDAAPFEQVGRALEALGSHGNATRAFSRALELRPADVDLHLLRAMSHVNNGQVEGAMHDYESALAQDAENLDALLGLAVVQSAAGLDVEAIATADRLVATHPELLRAYLLKAMVHEAARDAATAERVLKDLLTDHPGLAVAHRDLARLYRARAWNEEAAREQALACAFGDDSACMDVP